MDSMNACAAFAIRFVLLIGLPPFLSHHILALFWEYIHLYLRLSGRFIRGVFSLAGLVLCRHDQCLTDLVDIDLVTIFRNQSEGLCLVLFLLFPHFRKTPFKYIFFIGCSFLPGRGGLIIPGQPMTVKAATGIPTILELSYLISVSYTHLDRSIGGSA